MKIISKSLEKTLQHLAQTKADEFPFDHSKKSYWDRYSQLAAKLNSDMHTQVAAGSQAADGGMLTDHGPDHIQTVINRVACLLDDDKNENELSGYEIYLLLCAIHFHDLGNIKGRIKHEKIITDMMNEVSGFLGDATERKYIREIAEAHGGKVGNDKDTISHLESSATLFSHNVRLQALAGILRFADELADDLYRANSILLKLGSVPDSSLIYHKYACCLNSVVEAPAAKEIKLHYHINIDDFVKTFPKKIGSSENYSQIYLLDEIFERLSKMYSESIYCNRFTTPIVDIRSISVDIMCLKDQEKLGEKLPRIKFTLREKGYPEEKSLSIHQLTDNLSNWDNTGSNLTGSVFAEHVKQNFFPDGEPCE